MLGSQAADRDHPSTLVTRWTSAIGQKGKGKGKCYVCGKPGHYASECSQAQGGKHGGGKGKKGGKGSGGGKKGGKGTGRGFQGECNFCHRWGHKESECYKKQKAGNGKGQAVGALQAAQPAQPSPPP